VQAGNSGVSEFCLLDIALTPHLVCRERGEYAQEEKSLAGCVPGPGRTGERVKSPMFRRPRIHGF
jgi:hypothetical protein